MGDVKVQEPVKLFQLIQQLETPELCFEERLGIASQLREALDTLHEHAPPHSNNAVGFGNMSIMAKCLLEFQNMAQRQSL